jgi:hypothetical protein
MEESIVIEEQDISRSRGDTNAHSACNLIEFLESIRMIVGECGCFSTEWVLRVRSHHGTGLVYLDSTTVVDGYDGAFHGDALFFTIP